LGTQYVEFTFRSDFSINNIGWNIPVSSSGLPDGQPDPIALYKNLYLNDADYTKIGDTGSSTILVGYTASPDASNDTVYIKLKTQE
jgi:hypothetical protein